jgi:hypothetical protein
MKSNKKSVDLKIRKVSESNNYNEYEKVNSSLSRVVNLLIQTDKSTHMRTISIPTLVKMKNQDDNMAFQYSRRDKKIEIDENNIIDKLDGIYE